MFYNKLIKLIQRQTKAMVDIDYIFNYHIPNILSYYNKKILILINNTYY